MVNMLGRLPETSSQKLSDEAMTTLREISQAQIVTTTTTTTTVTA
eukprot:SAG31_NODE_42328_length_272_cov_0.601156_1_plen_44_part_01